MLDRGLLKPKILVVEDNVLVADAICDLVRDCGCDVAGAVGHVDRGVQFLADRAVDGAVIDINLHGSLSFSICDELQRRKVPFFFITGHSARAAIPPEFRTAPLLTKPIDAREFKSALAAFGVGTGAFEEVHEEARPRRGNLLLDTLGEQELAVLAPRLEHVTLREGQILETARQPIAHVHFLTHGLVSFVARCPQGRRIEIGMVGREGVAGISALLHSKGEAVGDAVVHVSGAAWRVAVDELLPLLQSHRDLHTHLLRYVHAFLAQVAETALSTGHAKIEQRLARWLLMAAERCGTTKLPVTHEHLSRALAVRRSGITVALHMLESRRFIKSQRKLVEILDRAGLMHQVEGLHGVDGGGPVGLRDQDNQTAG
jgi:CRP-like cAMP-binding protein